MEIAELIRYKIRTIILGSGLILRRSEVVRSYSLFSSQESGGSKRSSDVAPSENRAI